MSRISLDLAILLVAGSLAALMGGAIVIDPAAFHAVGGVRIGEDAGVSNEMRAAGGGILMVGLLALAGAFRTAIRDIALTANAAVYSGYGLARIYSFLVDGIPGSTLVWIAALELVLGAACFASTLHRSRNV